MPRYRPEREKQDVPGAGWSAGRGLKAKNPGRGRSGEGLIESIRPRQSGHEMHRGELLRHVASLKRERERAEQAALAKKRKRGPQVIDPKSFARRITPGVMEDFNRLLGQKAPPIESLSRPERHALSKYLDNPKNDYRTIKTAYAAEVRRSKAADFGASLHLARMELEKERWHEAFEMLQNMVGDYLNDSKLEIPQDKGQEAVALLRIISRAWLTAHASEYAGLDLEGFEPFKKGPGWGSGRILWSASAIFQLEKIGNIQDLPLLRLVGYGCGEGAMEGYCATAAGKIRVLEGLRLIFAKGTDEGLVKAKRLSEDQLVYRLSFIFNKLGLSNVIASMPQFAQFGRSGFSPVQNMVDAESMRKLTSEGLGRAFSLQPPYYGTGMDARGYMTAESFMLENALAEKQGEGCAAQLVLTEKGKMLVSALMARITEVEIGYQGSREDAMRTFMTELFGVLS